MISESLKNMYTRHSNDELNLISDDAVVAKRLLNLR